MCCRRSCRTLDIGLFGHWTLDSFLPLVLATRSCHIGLILPPAKRNHSTSDSAHSIPAASIKLKATASQDASVIVPNLSISVADSELGSQPKQVCPPFALSEEDADTVFFGPRGCCRKMCD